MIYNVYLCVSCFDSAENHEQLTCHLSKTGLHEMSNKDHKMMAKISQSVKFILE